MLTREEIRVIEEKHTQSANIVVVSHFNPDGDAIGSSLALMHFYKNCGFNVQVVLPNPFPDFLKWMPGAKDIVIAEKNSVLARKILKDADILYIVDMNAPHRSGKLLEQSIIDSTAFKILIDHHINPDITCDISFSTVDTSSTCELIYRYLYDDLKVESPLTLEMAQCLYVGIITDTGSLTYACNDPRTYIILSELIKTGVDGEYLHRLIYDNYGISRINLLGLSLSQRLKIFPEYATAYIYLTKEDLRENHYKIGDTEGFVNYGLSVKSVQFAAIFIQKDNKVRISFRSKGNFDVNLFARKHFNGGGHRNASAAYCHDSLENTIKYFESLLPLYKEELLHPYQK